MLSLLMPCLNPGRYLGECLDSALPQLSEVDELVVQDGGSTDGSLEVLAALAARDRRVRLVSARDSGQSDALNRALRRARGDLVGFLNADDLLLPGALDAVRAAVGTRVPEVVVGGWRFVQADGTPIREFPARELRTNPLLLLGCYAFTGGLYVRRDLLADGFGTALHYVMDFDLMLRLAERVTDQVLVHHPVAALRYHRDSKSGALGRRFWFEGTAVRRARARGPVQVGVALAGAALHSVTVATAWLRASPGYRELRRLVTR
ncbi:glycosyltransferase [Actinosynnema sp. NPDC020468]|uniref:glycosyltransferase n=1 Tax=Actinosynnema sp. NPDC020468 TaxID=3154488 RepID=UPI0033EDEACD